MLCKVYRGKEVQPTSWPNVDPTVSDTGTGAGKPQISSKEDIERAVQQVRVEAEAEVRKVREAAFAAGRQAAAADLEPIVKNLAQSIDALAAMRTVLRKQAESDLVKLSVEIARRILHREINVDPGALQGVVSHVLAQMSLREACTVRVHPDFAAALDKHFSANATRVRLVPDGSLARGDVLFESERGTLDASVSSQLQEIERGFIERLAQ